MGSKMLPLQILFAYRWREANANAQRAAGIIGMLPGNLQIQKSQKLSFAVAP